MYKLCVFAGTLEGRQLVEFLCTQKVQVTACVATQYGRTLLPQAENLTISAQRLTREEMEALLADGNFDCVIDATHPYAEAVTENLAAACACAGVEYLRLLREEGGVDGDTIFTENAQSAVEYLNRTQGNILLTIGSKELTRFARLEGFQERVYARVLPMEDSLQLCREAGLPPAHVLALQGPFSEEMNRAMLRSVSARYLVTKLTGHAGGLEEKLAAARSLGVTVVAIGRPTQREGRSLSELVTYLCDRYGLSWQPTVHIVGVGSGSADGWTAEVERAIAQSDCIIGARRMVEAAARPGQAVFCAIAPEEIADCIARHREYQSFVVVMSGDTGFFSGTKKLLPLLKNCTVQVLPGLSSLSCLCARLGTSYEDVVPVSLHGRDVDIVPAVLRHRRVFALVGGENGMGALCRRLTEAGLGAVRVSVGERLGYEEERITVGTAQELAQGRFHALSVALLEHERPWVVTHGLPDEAFLRGRSANGAVIPMTKSEVRAVCLSKLRLTRESICWDVGAGTGSVAIELALQADCGQVFAIERNEDAVALLQENRTRFAAENLKVISGSAPEACRELPAPTHVFLGGTAGNLREILTLLLEKNPNVRIVATAVTLESIAEITMCIKEFCFTETEAASMTVARDRSAGSYHLMTGQNPVYIFTMQAGGERA